MHKYNPIFETIKWQDMLKMDDEALLAKGVAALGARRKLLKVFDQVKAHCLANVSFLLFVFLIFLKKNTYFFLPLP